MNMPAPVDTMPPLFKSLTALRMAHTNLLKEYQNYDDDEDENRLPEPFIKKVELFLQRASSSGVLLDVDEDRSDAQALLNYWTTVLYNAEQTPRPTILANFEEEAAAQQVGERCPYRGLQAFHQEDRAFFYGRRQLAREMTRRLQKENFLAVVGLSGSGKSSVVRAGLIPALQEGALPGSESWIYYDTIVPGAEPLKSLAELIRPADVDAEQWYRQQRKQFLQGDAHLLQLVSSGHKTTVVVVDQFEELFTLSQDEPERRAFVANLVRLTKAPDMRHIVIITMRSEFDTYVARFPELQDLFEQAQIRVPPLNPLDLRKAIEKPAERSGLSFEAGLVEELVQQVLGEPAGLPLLQFTLYKLWEKREGKNITWAIYRELGGSPREVLSGVADATYQSFKFQEDRNISRRIMLRLVRPGAGLDVTSNRVRRASLQTVGARDNVNRVLDVWVKAGLLRVTAATKHEDDQIEVMHEALIRNWPKLVDWVEEERVNMRQRLQLTSAAQQWVEHRRDPGGLLGGTLLAEALTYDDLNNLEKDFVEVSQLAAVAAIEYEREQLQRLAHEQEERANQKTRAVRYFRFLTMSLAFLLILAVVATYTVWSKSREAQKQRDDAVEARGLAEGERGLAHQARAEALKQKVIAEARAKEAEDARKTAESAQKVIKAERERAENEAGNAERNFDELQRSIIEKARLTKEKERAEKAAEDAGEEINRYAIPSERVVITPAALGLRDFARPLRPGVSVSSLSNLVGSLCCVVRDSSGRRYLLSADHVIGGRIGESVLQPSRFDKGTEQNKVGTLSRVDKSLMMALAELLPGIEFSNTIPGLAGVGRINGTSDQVKPGDILYLVGRTSGAVKGKVKSVHTDVNIVKGGGDRTLLHSVIVTEKIAGGGDSGAPVLDQQGRLVGVLVGGSPDSSIIIPIKQILLALNVELEQ